MDKYKALKDTISEKMQGVLTELQGFNEITIPQSAFGNGDYSNPIRIHYISDLHIEAHMCAEGIDLCDKKAVNAYMGKLILRLFDKRTIYTMARYGISPDNMADVFDGYYYIFIDETRDLTDKEQKELGHKLFRKEINMPVSPRLLSCVIIDGDLADSVEIAKLFFSHMLRRIKYFYYLSWKKESFDLNRPKHILDKAEIERSLEERIAELKSKRKEARELLKEVEQETGKKIFSLYHGRYASEYRRLITDRQDIPNEACDYLDKIHDAEKEIENLELYPEEFYTKCSISISDFKYQEINFCPVYYVLGNHEYSNYSNVEETNNVYKEALKNYGITVLNKEAIEYGNCVVFGGTGFAKNNKNFNATNLVGPKEMYMNREYESMESDSTQLEYEQALSKAKSGEKPLLVITHYPLKDWMSSATDKYCYYFTGHNHKNSISLDNSSHIYADNQIGYESNDIEFKRALIGTDYNPFINYEDGIHEITAKQYSDFYKYTGEYVGIGLIRRQLTKNSKLYLIKRNGFFGFFIVSDRNTKICVGGRVKIVSEITDIRYFYESFSMMIYQYVAALLPLRKYQEKLSEMIKRLNIPYHNSGRIHGCIVDVDFYHHIMINPYDGGVTFYYSPYFGLVHKFESFDLLLESMEKHDHWLKENTSYLEAKEKMVQFGLIKQERNSNFEKKDLETIDIKNSLYGLSMRVNQLQRLFTSNILREWDDSIIKNLVGEEALIELAPEEKKLTDYNLVQKHWINLSKIESERITPKLVKCALKYKKKCHFPYTRMGKYGFVDRRSRLSNEEIRQYIEHIPKDVLKMVVKDFSDSLGIAFLVVFPMDILSENDYDYVFSNFSASSKEVLEIAKEIPDEKWNDMLGTRIAELVTVKNRPGYCSKELWAKICSYRI